MWKQILTVFQTVFTLARDLEESRSEIKSLREEVNKLTSAVVALKGQIDVIDQREQGEREKLELKFDLKQAARPKALSPAKKKARKK